MFARGLQPRLFRSRIFFSDLYFCEGVNQLLRTKLVHEGPRLSLSRLIDYALLCVGSSFAVGFAEEERDIAFVPVMAAAKYSKLLDIPVH